MMEYDDIYLKPEMSVNTDTWNNWNIPLDLEKSLEENMLFFADAVVSEYWGEMRLHLSPFEEERPVVLAGPGGLDDVWHYFDLEKLLVNGVRALAEEHMAGDRLDPSGAILLTRVKAIFDAASQEIEGALRFTEPGNTSQNDRNSQ